MGWREIPDPSTVSAGRVKATISLEGDDVAITTQLLKAALQHYLANGPIAAPPASAISAQHAAAPTMANLGAQPQAVSAAPGAPAT